MLKQKLQLKLSQKLSPQQIQLMKLVQLSALELEQKIQSEIGENPALETGKEIEENNNELDEFSDHDQEDNEVSNEDFDIDPYLSDDETPNYKLENSSYGNLKNESGNPFSSQISFHEYLKNQLQNLILDENEKPVADFIIGSIDNSGYIRRSDDDIIDDLAFTQNIIIDKSEFKKVINKIQLLDPPGVAARNLKECLLLQLKRKRKNKYSTLAKNMIETSFDEFSRKHYKKLQDRFSINENDLKLVLNEISKLNPKPGGALSGSAQNTHIIPDFILKIEDGDLKVSLNKRNSPELRISNNYKEMLSGYMIDPNKTKSQKEAILFIKQKLDAAKWFIDAVEQRYQTLYLTINAIVEYQREYFLSGDDHKLKPMVLKDIAKKIKMDISTISRVANSKYMDTPYGVKLLKDFFSEGMKNIEGEDVSTIEIKKTLESIISNEDKSKPSTDKLLSDLLREKGYNVARRTIAKYREQLGFPVARLRKKI
ncbi:MAG: RNA polymerase sigma-54 factor [Flavobacteriaceae bacterium TMED184]|nr:MAG: RNA polymerase sigma-54 factor [Flavobacteriaceae bacterium TMED184]